MPLLKTVDWKRALVELVVIVGGVLIALAVDQWNDGRLDRVAERQYLQSLIGDLEADLVELDSASTWASRHEQAATEVLSFLQGGLITEVDSLAKQILLAGWQYPPPFSLNTILELRSTGNLQLLRDPELKRQVSSYYALLENLKAINQPLQDRVWEDYDRYVKHLLPPYLRLKITESVIGPIPGFDSSDVAEPDIEAIRFRLRALPDIEATLGEVIYVGITQRDIWDDARTAATSLIEALEHNLDL
jgi:hypothetical protein